MIYTRILEPCSKRSSYKTASEFLEKPSYKLHDVSRALDVLGTECNLIQAELYKNSHFLGKRNDKILYYDCSNYYFEIEQEDGSKKYGKSKEHRPNPIIQTGLFMDGDGIPLAFSLFPGNSNEQTSLKPLEKKVPADFGCQKFIYCSISSLSDDIQEIFSFQNDQLVSVEYAITVPESEFQTVLQTLAHQAAELLEDLLVGENQILEGKTTRWEDEQKNSLILSFPDTDTSEERVIFLGLYRTKA